MSDEEYLNESELDSKIYAREALIMNVTEDILVAMEDKEVTKADLARMLHKSKSFVTQTLSGSRNMTLRTLTDIAFNLDLAVSIVFKNKTESVQIEPDSSQWNKDDMIVICQNAYKRYDVSEITSNDSSWHSPKDIVNLVK
jgi:transcriptional regulator with XRE-family HTH domain